MAETWEETRRRIVADRAQRVQETKELRRKLQLILDTHGWEDVIEYLADRAHDEYERSYRPYAKKLADALDTIASELW